MPDTLLAWLLQRTVPSWVWGLVVRYARTMCWRNHLLSNFTVEDAGRWGQRISLSRWSLSVHSTDNIKTHCKVILYISNRFTIDYDRYTTSGEVYNRHLLNVDVRLLKPTRLDARYSTVSSASQKPQSVSVIKTDSLGSARIIQTTLPQLR